MEEIRSWQSAKHTWLYSDLHQALKSRTLTALDSQQRNLNFCVHSTPLRRGGREGGGGDNKGGGADRQTGLGEC